MDTPATPEQIEAIRQAAIFRAGYLRWLAERLKTCDDILIRKAAADAILQLIEV